MSQQHILQVSELTKKVRFILESELSRVWLCGEISNFVGASSGHWYLSLKDSKSQVRCAMFKGANKNVRLSPRNGQQVLVRAKVSLYEPRGDFQLIIEQMEDAGTGLLRQQFEQLKQKLSAEGLFSHYHKQIIPKHLQTIGIVTSPTGAAVKDILTVLRRRNPNLAVIVYPALVQGTQAANDIVKAINIANTRKECDVLIVGRGGGSLEDLWSFNEESVVRSIYQSKLPIISAVGHEIDTTLSDYVADLRAATPSAAAELVSQDSSELSQKILILNQRLINANKTKLLTHRVSLNHICHRLSLVHPAQQLQNQQQKADELDNRLKLAMSRYLQTLTIKPQQLANHLQLLSPQNKIQQNKEKVAQLASKLIATIKQAQQQRGKLFAHTISELQIVSPLATIARGYSVTRDANGNIIKSIKEVNDNQKLTIQMSDGLVITKVITKQTNLAL
ncbi:MAG: exodeoxyribonuclease VII large subunit [Alteromonadaceae bacterium]|jgi:exodeoxyribonuclease VII large subunit